MTRLPLIAVAVAASLAVLVPATASAAVRTIGFDDLPANTEVGEQYAAQGVHFNVTGFPGTLPPQVCNHGAVTVSSFASSWTWPNYVRLSHCNPVEFGYVGILIRVDKSRSVSARVGGNYVARVEAYNGAGGIVAVQDAQTTGIPETLLQADSAAGDIEWAAFFFLNATGGSMSLDEFKFDVVEAAEPPPPPPTPNFQIASSDLANPQVIPPGGSVSADITIRRLSGSSGPINFSTLDLPAGVTATYSPNPAAGGDGEHVRVTFSAPADSPAVSGAGVTVVATPSNNSVGPSEQTLTTRLSVPGQVDLRVRGIDVIQAVQPDGLLIPSSPGIGGDYRGTLLAEGQQTIARVFAEAIGAAPPGVPGVVRLRGFDATGRELQDSPIFPIWAPSGIADRGNPLIFPDERADPGSAFTFVLPPSWTRGHLNLSADVSGREARFATEVPVLECTQPGCSANNRFELRNIPFEHQESRWIRPVLVFTQNGRQIPRPARAFAATRAVTPGPLTIPDIYAGLMNSTNIANATAPPTPNADTSDDAKELADWKNGATHGLVQAWADAYEGPGDVTVGINVGTARGLANGKVAIANFDEGTGSAAGDQRPLSSVAHETFHLFGRPHAGPECGAKDGGGFEIWPPDGRGRMASMGLDRRGTGAVDGSPPYRIFRDTETTKFYDLMSYCGSAGSGDPDLWVSLYNWEQIFEAHRAKAASSDASPAAAGAAAAAPQTLEVRAFATSTGVQISSVGPAGPRSPTPAAAGPFNVVARDAAGAELARVPLELTSGSDEGIAFLRGRVPARGVAKVEIETGGLVLATRNRSSSPPKVRLRGPRKGARVGRGRNVTLRWKARDADGDPLTASVDYSGNGGRSWRTLYIGPSTGRAKVPSRLLFGSRRARLRVRVNDGFNESSALSGTFRSLGAKPSVNITSPSAGLSVPSDAAVLLTAEAFDDALRPLRGRRLTWHLGKRRIARGESASVSGLPAGKRRIRLVARDRSGRTARASVVVRLAQAQPTFLTLTAPPKIGRRARRLRLRVASSVPATLRVAGQRFRVDRKPRRLRVRIRPGKTALTLRVVLRAGEQRSERALVIAR